jgi:hypothetical protein
LHGPLWTSGALSVPAISKCREAAKCDHTVSYAQRLFQGPASDGLAVSSHLPPLARYASLFLPGCAFTPSTLSEPIASSCSGRLCVISVVPLVSMEGSGTHETKGGYPGLTSTTLILRDVVWPL